MSDRFKNASPHVFKRRPKKSKREKKNKKEDPRKVTKKIALVLQVFILKSR